MTDKLVERLRRGVTWSDGTRIDAVVGEVNDPVLWEAADLIQSQSLLINEAVEALERAKWQIASMDKDKAWISRDVKATLAIVKAARAKLKGQQQ